MQFDVIIGNPPYQLQDGGHLASATPIYHKFIEQAINLEPRLLTMVVPSRWFQGGRGLGEFRSKMLNDGRIRVIVDFIKDKDAFPSINVNGGVNYFLWDRDSPGECRITTIEPGGEVGISKSRRLNEFDILVRRSQSLSILRKVCSQHEPSFSRRVSPLKPFGLRSSFHGGQKCTRSADVKLHGSGAVTWVSRDTIETNHSWIDQWKVLVGRATDGNEKYPLPIWDQRGPFVAGPGEACSETYLVASVERSEIEAKRRVEYMCSVFFRFLVSIRKITQDNKADVFAFVPDVEMDRSWSDTLLFKRYGISSDEVSFMRSIIREMDFAG